MRIAGSEEKKTCGPDRAAESNAAVTGRIQAFIVKRSVMHARSVCSSRSSLCRADMLESGR